MFGKYAGNNIIPDGSVRNIPPTFPTSTIVTKTGGVNSDGSSSFTRQIVRYNDKNIVPSNPNETYVDSNTEHQREDIV